MVLTEEENLVPHDACDTYFKASAEKSENPAEEEDATTDHRLSY